MLTAVVLVLLALWLIYAIRKIRRHDTSGCGGDCEHCRKRCK